MTPSLLLSLALLGTTAALGAGLLGRVAPFLDALERWVYGGTLGVVLGSLAMLALALVFGLTAPVAGTVAVAAAVSAYPLLRGGASGQRRASFRLLPPLAAGVLLIVLLRLGLFWSGAVRVEHDGMWVTQANLWADWAQHLGDVTAFAHGDNFPPQQTRLAGVPLAYHYLTSITTGAMVALGMTPWSALSLHSFVFSVVIVLAVFAMARRFTGDPAAAGLATALFLVGGGLGWVPVVREWLTADRWFVPLWDRNLQDAENFRWLDVFFSSIAPQRAYLYGIPLFALILTLLRQAIASAGWRGFAIAGLVAGLLPLAHLGVLLTLAIVTPVLLVLFPGRGWLAFFGAWIALGLPQLLLQQGGAPAALAAFRWAPGWVAAPDPWLWFWAKNLGLFLPLLLVALGDATLLDRTTRRVLWAFMALFVVANLFVFQPWDWDNTKLLVFWYLASCTSVGALLVRLWRRHPAVTARALVVAAVASLVLSGVLQHVHQMTGRDRNRLFTRDELELASLVRQTTDRHAVFLTGQQHNHPIHVMAGRVVVLGYPGWLWSQGYDCGERQRDVASMYALEPGADRLLERYGVDYVVVGPWERERLGADPDAFRTRLRSVLRTESYEIFSTAPGARSTSDAPGPPTAKPESTGG